MKSNVKRVENKIYWYWSDQGGVDFSEDWFDEEDNYRHSVGNYFDREEDVVEFTYHVTVEKPLKADTPSKNEEKFVQIATPEGVLYGLTNKGRLFAVTVSKDKWETLKTPDFKNIK